MHYCFEVEADPSPRSVDLYVGGAPGPIVLEASAPGLASATVSVATSVDPSDAVLEVASKFGSKAVFFD